MKKYLKAELRTGKGPPIKGKVRNIEQPIVITTDRPDMAGTSPQWESWARRWFDACMEAFPQVPRNVEVNPRRSNITEWDVLIVCEESGARIPEIIPDANARGGYRYEQPAAPSAFAFVIDLGKKPDR